MAVHRLTVFALKAIIAAALLAILFSRLETGHIFDIIVSAKPSILILSFVVFVVRILFGAWRNSILLTFGGDRFGLFTLVRYYFIGFFFNMFLPTVVGGDIARGYYLYKGSGGSEKTIGSIIVERVLGILAMMFLSAVSVLICYFAGYDLYARNVVRIIFISFGIGLVVSFLMFGTTGRIVERMIPEGLSRKFALPVNVIRSMISYGKAPGLLISAFGLSVAFQLPSIVSTYFIGRSLGDGTAFVYYVILMPVIWLISMIPVSINGLGVREGAFVILFGGIGMSYETAMAIGLLRLAQTVALGVIGNVVFLAEKGSVSEIQTYSETQPYKIQ